jgi:hypothetical protein
VTIALARLRRTGISAQVSPSRRRSRGKHVHCLQAPLVFLNVKMEFLVRLLQGEHGFSRLALKCAGYRILLCGHLHLRGGMKRASLWESPADTPDWSATLVGACFVVKNIVETARSSRILAVGAERNARAISIADVSRLLGGGLSWH